MTVINEANITNDIAAYSAACDLFYETYGHNISDVIFGSKESDWDNADLVADAKVLDSWDCWLFVATACPNYADYEAWSANGGYDSPEATEAIMDHMGSGNVEFLTEYATVIPKDELIKAIGPIA